MESIIEERDGKLFILDPWTAHYSVPVRYRLAWPTGVDARDYPDLVGCKARHYGLGIYGTDTGVMVRLEDGDRTKPDARFTEERKIPKPDGTHEYRNGRWVR